MARVPVPDPFHPRKNRKPDVFLNIPYDNQFSDLFLAYIAGTVALGLVPHLALEISGGERRLDRIFDLIQRCPYSIHDMSRVEMSRGNPPTPRFNMPLELGLAIAWQKMNPSRHTWFLFESRNWRIEKSLSDLKGTDVHIHHRRPKVLFSETVQCLCQVASTGQRDSDGTDICRPAHRTAVHHA